MSVHDHAGAAVSPDEIRASLLRAIGGSSSSLAAEASADVRSDNGSSAVEIAVPVQRPGAARVLVTGRVTVTGMSRPAFEIDVARTLEEFLVTAGLTAAEDDSRPPWSFATIPAPG